MQRTQYRRTVHGLFLAASCLILSPAISAQEVVCGPDCEVCGGRSPISRLGVGDGQIRGQIRGRIQGLAQNRGNGDFQQRPIDYGTPDLFYNFYPDTTSSQTGAEMYISPRPVPAHVGHTYITYQPLMPHQFLYPHHHSYQRYYENGRGLTRASVTHYYPPVRTAVVGAIHHFKIPR